MCFNCSRQSLSLSHGGEKEPSPPTNMETNTIWAPADSEKYQVFKQAASEGNVKQLETALRSGINVDALYGDGLEGYSVLHEAALKGNIEVIEYLLAHGANVDVRDAGQFGGSTPLIYAAQGAHVDAVRVLLDARADIDARGPNDDTVLSAVLPDGIQVTQRHIDTIILLLDYGVDINFRASAYGATVVSEKTPALVAEYSDAYVARTSSQIGRSQSHQHTPRKRSYSRRLTRYSSRIPRKRRHSQLPHQPRCQRHHLLRLSPGSETKQNRNSQSTSSSKSQSRTPWPSWSAPYGRPHGTLRHANAAPRQRPRYHHNRRLRSHASSRCLWNR